MLFFSCFSFLLVGKRILRQIPVLQTLPDKEVFPEILEIIWEESLGTTPTAVQQGTLQDLEG
jgi:hypothetical protein